MTRKLVPLLRHEDIIYGELMSMSAGHVSLPLCCSFHSITEGFVILCCQCWSRVNLNASMKFKVDLHALKSEGTDLFCFVC